jgi:amino acid adenylation domain-containing protein
MVIDGFGERKAGYRVRQDDSGYGEPSVLDAAAFKGRGSGQRPDFATEILAITSSSAIDRGVSSSRESTNGRITMTRDDEAALIDSPSLGSILSCRCHSEPPEYDPGELLSTPLLKSAWVDVIGKDIAEIGELAKHGVFAYCEIQTILDVRLVYAEVLWREALVLMDQSRTPSTGCDHLFKNLDLDTTMTGSTHTIPELLGASFAAMPFRPAAEFSGIALSRSELAEQSDRLARWLIANEQVVGSLVGIYMERSIEMLVGVLGVLKAGAAFVPLDPLFPRSRTERILGETKLPVLLTLTRHLPALPVSDARTLCLDGEIDRWKDPPPLPLPRLDANTRAYVIFTSGSTGIPKGVEVTHGSIVNLLGAAQQLLELGEQDRLFAITTLAFDISVLELLLPLICGGTVIIGDKDAGADGSRLMDQLVARRATVLQGTPVTFRRLLDAGFKPPLGFKMLCGGEAWTIALADQLLATGTRLWNMYGPTETTIWSSMTEVKRGDTRLTIGPPIANTRFYVMDEDLGPIPAGGQGELLIAGTGVALGYFQSELLTAEKFLPDPNMPGERMYRTGDQVRLLADGRIEFIGRLDQQIKLRGHRIELGEIESCMMTCAGVREAVAVLRNDESDQAFLIGFYTAAYDVTPVLLRETLTKQLPGYMIPRYFARLEAFPLTPNGKTDRRTLATYRWTAISSEPSAAGQTHSLTESEMLPMWNKLFPGQTIISDSDFFELGGDSLLLVMLQSMIRNKFGLRLEAIDIRNHFTVSKLAQWVDERLAGGTSEEDPAQDPRVLPLQDLGAGPPIFILPQMMNFRVLAEELGPEQPVYAIQLMDDDVGEETGLASMEDLAHLYIRLIRKMQPTGPYRLGGWCVWGWMAYEIARLLEGEGETVEFLAVFDALAPGFWEQYSSPRQFLIKMTLLLHRLGGFVVRLWRVSFADKGKDRLRRLRTLNLSIALALPRRLRPEGFATEETHLEQVVAQAARSYKPRPIKANVLLFTSQTRPTGSLMGNDMGWGAVLKHTVRLNTLVGNHHEIFHPAAARVMAAHIRQVLGLKSEVVSHS